ncbi:MAG: alpha-glucan family phosphorylase [Planctomycetota bacterium]
MPDLPEALKPLEEIAHNLWWSWHPEAIKLFTRLDRELWEETNHNPVALLGRIGQDRLERFANDRSFLSALSEVHAAFVHHHERRSWFERVHEAACERSGDGTNGEPLRIAYFCAEFGLTECFQIYSGGLGCLAGDHLKSASELGVPLCGVGLLYRCGYFRQYLNAEGWQQERYPELDTGNLPVRRVLDEQGEQLRVHVTLPEREIAVGIWRCNVGRVPLYLLDTNMDENSPEDRDITRSLYGGDAEHRIKQEIVLGIGGMRALDVVGERPNVFHANEGHAAFLSLERIARNRAEHGASFEEAIQAGSASTVFTTHTPVPAGIDRFSPELVERYLGHELGRLGCDMDHLLGLGRANPFDENEFFSMAVLAIRTSRFSNGVSALHGEVSRDMWNNLWPGMPSHEVPIGHVTNGVHPRSWIAKVLAGMFDRYVSPEWELDPRDHSIWSKVQNIPNDELWDFRNAQRSQLITWARERVRHQLSSRGLGTSQIEKRVSLLDPDVLTIGFARRFATYKRGNLLLRDPQRLRALLNNIDGPVQILVAGKAHPADSPGKSLIRDIDRFAHEAGQRTPIFFLEDYDIDVARHLVQGCDVWLNNPRRGMEASGTSGMKGAMNGVINCSILDGWWDEAWNPRVGFAIGSGEEYQDSAMADEIEGNALYDLLERQIVPEFYARDETGTPTRWVERIKDCIAELTPAFSTGRMVADYAEQYYLEAWQLRKKLAGDNIQNAKELSDQIHRLREFWGGISIDSVRTDAGPTVSVRSAVNVTAEVTLGALRPDEVSVEVYHGSVTSVGELLHSATIQMQTTGGDEHEGRFTFEGAFSPSRSGHAGFAVRIMPRDERLEGTVVPGLILWHGHPIAERAKATSA